MKFVIQRVKKAEVNINNKTVGKIIEKVNKGNREIVLKKKRIKR